MVIIGKIGIHMSYLMFYFRCKANKCSCFISKKWQEGVANFRNGAIISALVRPPHKNFGGRLQGNIIGALHENTVGKRHGAKQREVIFFGELLEDGFVCVSAVENRG